MFCPTNSQQLNDIQCTINREKQIFATEKLEPANIRNFCLKYDWNDSSIIKIVAD